MKPLIFLVLLTAAVYGTAVADEEVPLDAVWVMELKGAVGPATSDYLVRGLNRAKEAQARLVVLRMDTPGGLDGAMRDIVNAILASPVPVATYVSPQGARAASAGTYILYASHIAAMATATNLGAATPVSIGGPAPPGPADDPGDEPGDGADDSGGAMERKMVNDAAAYIRGLAGLRGRNAEWAEEAVRKASSLTALEALEAGVIDLVADNLRELLTAVDGREITLQQGSVTLDLAGAPIFEAAPDWRTEFLATITNPSLVLILGMIGFYGIILEFYNPGSLVPGTIGVICLLLAGYSLQLLPVNYAGVALLLVGVGLMVAEAISPSFGILGAGGLVAFMIGGVIMFDTEVEAYRVGLPLLAAVGIGTAAFIIITITIALRMRDQAVTTGVQVMLGQTGVVLSDFNGSVVSEVAAAAGEQAAGKSGTGGTVVFGQVRIGGEIWEAQSTQELRAGEHVVVRDIHGLKLLVEREQS